MEVTSLKASIECFVEVPTGSFKVTSLKAFVKALVKDCVNVVFTEEEAFVKVTSMEAFAKSFVDLLVCNSPLKLS